jgi:hypothetical protein
MDEKKSIRQELKLHRRSVAAIVLVLIIIITAVLYVTYFNKQGNEYTYSKLDNYSLTKDMYGSGYSFSKPIEMMYIRTNRTAVSMYHRLPNTKLGSYIAAGSVHLGHPMFTSDINAYNRVLSTPSDKYYQRTANGITVFAKENLFGSAKIKVAQAQKFTNSTIKKNAWTFDYTAEGTGDTKSFKGREAFAITDKGMYYLDVYAPDANWNNNKKIWDQVFSSWKLDQ